MCAFFLNLWYIYLFLELFSSNCYTKNFHEIKKGKHIHIYVFTTSRQQLFSPYPLIFSCEGNTRTLQNVWEVQVALDLRQVLSLCLRFLIQKNNDLLVVPSFSCADYKSTFIKHLERRLTLSMCLLNKMNKYLKRTGHP